MDFFTVPSPKRGTLRYEEKFNRRVEESSSPTEAGKQQDYLGAVATITWVSLGLLLSAVSQHMNPSIALRAKHHSDSPNSAPDASQTTGECERSVLVHDAMRQL